MDKIRSLVNSIKADPSHSQSATTHDVIASANTFKTVIGDPYITSVYPVPVGSTYAVSPLGSSSLDNARLQLTPSFPTSFQSHSRPIVITRIRSFFKSIKARSSQSQWTTTQNIIASSDACKTASGDQHITEVFPAPLASASSTLDGAGIQLPSSHPTLSPDHTMNRRRSHGTTAQDLIASSDGFKTVIGARYITEVHLLASTSVPSPFNDAPADNLSIHFTGRQRELSLIADAFKKSRNTPIRCALFGNQGVGKSQIAYSWANSTFAANENAYVMWISAITIEKVYQGFSRLLRYVDHPDKSSRDLDAQLVTACRWLEEVNTENWLLIFDDVVPETADFLQRHLPRVNGRGTIIFTTRSQDVAIAVARTAGERHEVIEVPLLNVNEGVELFCRYFDAGKVDPLSARSRRS